MSGTLTVSRGNKPKPLIYTGTPPAETEIACAGAAGVYTTAAGGIIEVGAHRRLHLWLAIDAAAAGNILSILPLYAVSPTKPAPTDDSWFLPGFFDGVPTAGTLTAASLPANTDFTVSPDFARALHRQLDIRTEPMDGATDEQRIVITLDVSAASWVQILYAEAGVVGTPCSVLGRYTLSTG